MLNQIIMYPMKGLSPQERHQRFSQQARWTKSLREYIFPRIGLQAAIRVLDIGCGTGALFDEIHDLIDAQLYGLDIDFRHLVLARAKGDIPVSQGDAHRLPFPNGISEITLCHFLLLWVQDPAQVLREMVRVTSPGGVVLALAEPDYGGRIDYPPELEQLGQWQTEALKQQGADPFVGRKLSSLFHQAGLQEVETGVLGGQWLGKPSEKEIDLEWAVLEADLGKGFENHQTLKEINSKAWSSGERVLFLPTFYALGRVPE